MDEKGQVTIRMKIVDRDGNEHEGVFPVAGSLMEALRDHDFDVAAICGGMCSCATCHVYIAAEWIDRLPPRQADERELVTELQHYRASSRLSCQITMDQELDGLCLTLAPEE